MAHLNRKRLLCLWLPNWPIQRWFAALRANEPERFTDEPTNTAVGGENSSSTTSPPLVLWGQDPRRGRVVVARCHQARQLGVRPGITISQADSLVRGGMHSPKPASAQPFAARKAKKEKGSSEEKGSDPDSRNGPLGASHYRGLPPFPHSHYRGLPPFPHATEPWMEPHDSQADLDALHLLAEKCAERLSPLIAIEPLDDFLWAGQILHQPQALVMDVTGMGSLFGDETELLRVAGTLIAQEGYTARAAIADTAGAAWAVSHYRPPEVDPESVACGQSQVDAIERMETPSIVAWRVPPDSQAVALADLPVAALRVSSETTAMLRRLGVHHIHALRQLPRSGLASRLGPALLRRLDEALGEIDESLHMHHAAASNQAKTDLEYPTDDQDILAHRIEQLIQQVADALQDRQYGALRMTCRLELQDDSPIDLRLGLFKPTAQGDHLTRLFRGLLERQTLRSQVSKITVTATMTGPLGVRQPSFSSMDEGPTATASDWARLIDTLSGRLGREQVLGAEVTHNPLPESTIRFRPLTGQPIGAIVPGRPVSQRPKRRRARRNARPKASEHRREASIYDAAGTSRPPAIATHRDPLRRPVQLLPHPQKIHALSPYSRDRPAQDASAPSTTEEPPLAFRRGGQHFRVARFWGPERLETGWWDGPLHRRDYYRIETTSGSWFWIYQDLRDHGWYLHAHF